MLRSAADENSASIDFPGALDAILGKDGATSLNSASEKLNSVGFSLGDLTFSVMSGTDEDISFVRDANMPKRNGLSRACSTVIRPVLLTLTGVGGSLKQPGSSKTS